MEDREALTMTVSGIIRKNKQRYVHVRFEREENGKKQYAEGLLPDCTIEKSEGFTNEELVGLRMYLSAQQEEIFKKAQEINDNNIWLH